MTDHDAGSTHRIVVGVDGSRGSKTALAWAMNQARLTGTTLEAVTTWQNPMQYGTAAEALLHAAVGAEMLVVGSRGNGTFAGILLGSVSQHCVQHALCPVVVVPQAE